MKTLFIIIHCLLVVFFVHAHTYESLGIDAVQKLEAEEKMAVKTKFPVINISTRDNHELILSKEIYTDCVIDLFNVEEERFQLKETSAGIRVRGNSSGFYGDPEKIKVNTVPYKIKFDKKVNMLGLHQGKKFKTWVLLKSYSELIQNDIAFRMGRTLSEGKYYVSDSTFVKLYINDLYQGIYVLCEQNEVNENRVNIYEPDKYYNGTDIGYYFEIDNYYTDEKNIGKFFSLDYEKAMVKDIRGEERKLFHAEYSVKSDFNIQEQLDFIGNYTKNVFKILYLAVEKKEYQTFDDDFHLVNSTYTNAEDTISAVLDIDSVIDMYLLYEMVHDYDVGEGSFYFAVDFSKTSNMKKLQMVSPWDFIWAYADSPRRYWAGSFCDAGFARWVGDRSNPWFIELAKEEWFHELTAKKWEKFSSRVKAEIDAEVDFYRKNEEEILDTDSNSMKAFANIIQWLNDRYEWMNEAFIPGKGITIPCENDHCEGVVEAKEVKNEEIREEVKAVKEINDEDIEITEEVNNEDEDSISDEETTINF